MLLKDQFGDMIMIIIILNNRISGSVTFTKSGFNYIELWYIDAIDNTNYLCFDVFVEKKNK